MKVYWHSNVYQKTYHPVLGLLENDKIFELEDEKAIHYVTSGLIIKVKEDSASFNVVKKRKKKTYKRRKKEA